VAEIGKSGNKYRILIEKFLGKWAFRKLRRWDDNIKMDLGK
jgi:hypothetical protein